MGLPGNSLTVSLILSFEFFFSLCLQFWGTGTCIYMYMYGFLKSIFFCF